MNLRVILLLFACLLSSCMANRMYHTRVADDWGEGVLRKVQVEGGGVLIASLLGSLSRHCPAIVAVDADAELRFVLSSGDSDFLALSCYRVQNGELLFSRSYIWTNRSEKAVRKLFDDFARELQRELTTRFPAVGKGKA